MEKISFGTDGWRAVISEDFTFENVKIVAQAIADYVMSEKRNIKNKKSPLYGRKLSVVVGYDTRFLSEKYAELISCVLSANGIKVILSDRPSPTPSVSFSIIRKKCIGGVMVTASHNPARYNGIKYKGYFGGSVGTEITDFLESRLYETTPKILDINTATKKGLIRKEDIVTPHIKAIKKYANMRILRNSKLRILVDSMNGTGKNYIEDVLKGTKNVVTTINGSRDPYFGGRSPEPNEVHLKSTADAVKKGNFDIAVATDGDADRVGVVLPNGKILSGHKVMTLLFLHLLEDRGITGEVIQTICGTGLIDKICKTYGIKTHETHVGFKYIADIMINEDVLVGGEETGGVAFKGWLPERDGILSALLIIEMIAERKMSLEKILSNIEKAYGKYVYKRCDLKYSLNKRKRLMDSLKKKPFKKILNKDVVGVKSFDGIKFILSDGSWLMLRSSGTEPKLRVYSEGHSEKEATKLVDFGKRFASSF